jgi:hypothetical protein
MFFFLYFFVLHFIRLIYNATAARYNGEEGDLAGTGPIRRDTSYGARYVIFFIFFICFTASTNLLYLLDLYGTMVATAACYNGEERSSAGTQWAHTTRHVIWGWYVYFY